ncbi:GT4 family glycosyltransferase PelF [Lederbergia citri]|uniref:GT4 family glycosyltransferase PelF n=1 Tax=Lederbergia citri TaxID=2833580 RepID=A0A942THZ0_9BACI|nr:GT4 family glycosyltransferase PelF [Lederbergia citri]MBS4196424.1 GT4 family glycosyltransferase PelF [Lederbergia citri]
MKICLIAEGSYPYVVGGVSSWVQTLITSMPEHEFIIYAIGADEKDKGKFKYDLPNNLIEVREIFLNSSLNVSVKSGKRYMLKQGQKQAIKSLLVNGDGNWEEFFSLFKGRYRSINTDTVTEFITSKDLYDIVKEVCFEHFPELPFTQLYWSVRSMLLPLLSVLASPPPEADMYHSISTGYAGIVGAYSKYYYDRPFIVTEHGIYTREREEEIIKSDGIKGMMKGLWIKHFHSLSKGAYASADQVITLFNKNKEIQIEIGCPEEKIRIIPNGVKLESYSFLPQKGKEDEEFVDIGAVVRVVPIKDIKTMIQSFAIVKRAIPNSRFYILGPKDEDPDYYEECLQLVNFLDLQDIYFAGTVNVKQYIGKMDILVLSSISEGQPLVLLEGMASGKPFVSTDVGSCKELLYGLDDRFGSAGYIVPVMDYVKMARAIINLAQKPNIRIKMAENGRNRVKASYSLETFIQQYRKIYGKRGYSDGGNRISTKKVSR